MTAGDGSTSSVSKRRVQESSKTSSNCHWFIAVLIAANILLDLCCIATAAYALNVHVSKQVSISNGMAETAEVIDDASLEMLFESVNTTQYQLRLLMEEVSVLSVTLVNNTMTPGNYRAKLIHYSIQLCHRFTWAKWRPRCSGRVRPQRKQRVTRRTWTRW